MLKRLIDWLFREQREQLAAIIVDQGASILELGGQVRSLELRVEDCELEVQQMTRLVGEYGRELETVAVIVHSLPKPPAEYRNVGDIARDFVQKRDEGLTKRTIPNKIASNPDAHDAQSPHPIQTRRPVQVD